MEITSKIAIFRKKINYNQIEKRRRTYLYSYCRQDRGRWSYEWVYCNEYVTVRIWLMNAETKWRIDTLWRYSSRRFCNLKPWNPVNKTVMKQKIKEKKLWWTLGSDGKRNDRIRVSCYKACFLNKTKAQTRKKTSVNETQSVWLLDVATRGERQSLLYSRRET